jgi:HAD superfamily phosphoserine phosphatase-like hydrolase
MKQIAVFDWDETLRKNFVLFDWMLFLNKKGTVKIKFLNRLINTFKMYKRNKISYKELAVMANEIYAESLKEVKKDILIKFAKLFVKNDNRNLFNFTSPLFDYLNKNNIDIYIVSGAPEEVLHAYKDFFNIENIYVYGLQFEINQYKYTGKIKKNTALYENKKQIIDSLRKDHKILLGMGDSVSDIPLLENADIPVAVNNTDIKLKEVLYINSDIDFNNLIKSFEYIRKIKKV